MAKVRIVAPGFTAYMELSDFDIPDDLSCRINGESASNPNVANEGDVVIFSPEYVKADLGLLAYEYARIQ